MFALEIPGPKMDYQKVHFEELYKDKEIINLDLSGLRRELGRLSCCASDSKGTGLGDPLNLAIVGDLLASNAVEKIGYVKVTEPVSQSAPRQNLTGDDYFTDGLMAVIFLADRYIPYNEVTFLGWETPSH